MPARKAEKWVAPATCMVFLGIEADSEKLTLEITQSKVLEVLSQLGHRVQADTATKKEIQSIAVKLQFLASSVHPGRIFLSPES